MFIWKLVYQDVYLEKSTLGFWKLVHEDVHLETSNLRNKTGKFQTYYRGTRETSQIYRYKI